MLYIQYNSSNKDWARQNRINQTKAEQLVRAVLRKRQLWYLFLRQKMIDSFILDFYCSELLLWIEVDGESHEYNQEYDIQRDEKLRHIWVKIIRYRNDDVFNDLEWFRKDVLEEIKIRKEEIDCWSNPPQPSFVKEGASKHSSLEKGRRGGICDYIAFILS